MTEQDIKDHGAVIRETLQQIVAADLPPAERERLWLLVSSAYGLLENLLVDVNRMATALEQLYTLERYK